MTLEALLEHFDVMTEAPNGVQKLRELVLQLAVRGRLVPQDANDEPAVVFLSRTSSEGKHFRAQRFGRQESSARPPDEEGLSELPTGWTRVRLGALGEFMGGGTPSKSDSALWDGDIPWVSPKDMKRLRISDTADHITTKALSQSAVQLIPPGALLMVVRGMILARTFPVAIADRDLTINQDMKALAPKKPELSEYLLLSLQALGPRVLRDVERSTHGTCRLASAVLDQLPIALPPLREQRRILTKVAELLSLCDLLESRRKCAQEKAAHLAASIVDRYSTA